MKDYGLVLSGGGTKGAFEIGVWQALREIGISTPCVIGTSVGALNAALIAQNNFDRALSFWQHLTINEVLKLNEHMAGKYVEEWSGTPFDTFRRGFLHDLFHGGLDISPLRDNLEALIDEDAIRKSPIRLGLVTVELSTLRPLQMMIDDVPEGKLIDYLLASAALPVFQRQEIGGKTYLDGGFYDNVPINFMLDIGCKNIIAVEFPAPGIRKRIKSSAHELIIVENSEHLGMTLEFDKNTIAHNLELGFLDTLKTLHALSGKRYYCDLTGESKRYEHLAHFMAKPYRDPVITKKLCKLLALPETSTYREIAAAIGAAVRDSGYPPDEPPLLCLLETAARATGVPRLKRYTPDALITAILEALNQQIQKNLAIIQSPKNIHQAFTDGCDAPKSSNRLDFITFYVLFVSAKPDMPVTRLNALIHKFSPETTLAIVTLILIHQMLKEQRQ